MNPLHLRRYTCPAVPSEAIKIYPAPGYCASMNVNQPSIDPKDRFNHDKERGKWGHDMEYYFAIAGHGVGLRSIALLSYAIGNYYVLSPILTLVLSLGIFSAFYFLEGYAGQFSSTGFLSAFRACPPMKGLGYAMLSLNLLTVIYYSVIAAYPLALLYRLFNYKVPWTTEPYIPQLDNLTLTEEKLILRGGRFDGTSRQSVFFLKQISKYIDGWQDISLAPVIMVCVVIIWALAAACLSRGVKSVGKAVYFTAGFAFLLNLIFFVHGNIQREIASEYDLSTWNQYSEGQFWLQAAVAALLAFSQGHGVMLTMSSYNRFRASLHKAPIWIYLVTYWGNLFPVVFGLQFTVLMRYLGVDGGFIGNNVNTFNLAFLLYPEFSSALGRSQIWSGILYMALFLCEFHTIVIQTFAILTSIFDEFPITRSKKLPITIGACVIFCAFAIGMASQGMVPPIDKMIYVFAAIQTFFIIGEVFAFAWFFGFKKFKKDCSFMLPTSTWMVNAHICTVVLPLLAIMIATLLFVFKFEGVPNTCYTFACPIAMGVAVACLLSCPAYFLFDVVKKRFKDIFKSEKWLPANERDHLEYIKPKLTGFYPAHVVLWPPQPQRAVLS